MMSPERAYRLRSAFAGYARGIGTRPFAKVAQRPCSGPHGESRAAAWQEPWDHLLNIRYKHHNIAKPSLLLGELSQVLNKLRGPVEQKA